MGLESQGVKIKRSDTASYTTVASSVITVTSSGIESSDTAQANFLAVGASFVPNMRIEIYSSNDNNTAIYTVSSATAVSKTKITLYETVTADAATSHEITGHVMNNIGEIISFSGPSGAAAVIDITNLASTAKEKLIGLRDEGQLALEVNYDNTATALQMVINTDRQARNKGYYEVELTDGSTAGTFLFMDAYVTGFSLSGAVDDVIKGSITLEVDGEVHWTKSTR